MHTCHTTSQLKGLLRELSAVLTNSCVSCRSAAMAPKVKAKSGSRRVTIRQVREAPVSEGRLVTLVNPIVPYELQLLSSRTQSYYDNPRVPAFTIEVIADFIMNANWTTTQHYVQLMLVYAPGLLFRVAGALMNRQAAERTRVRLALDGRLPLAVTPSGVMRA